MQRRTKIIATIGPASDDPAVLADMIEAGMDVARIGLAHSDLDGAIARYKRIRAVAAEMRRDVGILIDLPGPKVRTASFPDGGITVAMDDRVNVRVGNEASTATDIEVDYDHLLGDVIAGDLLTFGDGNVEIEVLAMQADHFEARVTHGGALSGRPGLRIPADRLSVSTPTPQDMLQLDAFVDEGVDIVAISFVRSGHDLRHIAVEPHPRGPLIVAKIETRAAVHNLSGIIAESGGIMVARGDLGVECPIEEVPHLQKRIIRECIASGLPVITATQMLDSMVTSPMPTRAEATDVANAVFDGSSAVMLSAETAIGKHPVKVIETMANIARRADMEFDYEGWGKRITEEHELGDDEAAAITDAMTMAAWRVARELDLAALICVSGSGFTVRSMARFRPKAPILGFSANPRTVAQLTMSWGVKPILAERVSSYEERVTSAVERARRERFVQSGDLIGILAGVDSSGRKTDILRLVHVP